MPETMASINAWVDEHFGPAASRFRVAARASEELAEAVRAISADPAGEAAAVEAADTIIVLCRLAKAGGLDWGAFEVNERVVPATFPTTVQYFTYANRQMAQLLTDLALDDNHPDFIGPLMRCYVTLQFAIRRFGLEPSDVIDGKMVVNRGRTWKRHGDGTGYHVRDKQPDKVSAKPAGTFMGFPVFVSQAMPDDSLIAFGNKLNSAAPLDAVGVSRGGVGKIALKGTDVHNLDRRIPPGLATVL